MKLLTIPFLTLVFLVGSLNETQAQSACEDLAGNTAYQELVAEGVVLLKGSSYDDAMERFTAAQKICPFDPGVTYYMARTKHLSGDCEMALFLYDQTLAHLSAGLVSSSVTVADVEKRRNEECVAAAPPSLASVSIRSRSEKATDGSGSATLGWVAVGVGAALVGTGVALTLVAKGERSEVNQARWLWHEGYPVTIGLTQAEAEAKMTSANTLEGVGWTAVGLGGAAVVTGVVLLLSDEGNAESDVSATWWGAGGAVVWTGRF